MTDKEKKLAAHLAAMCCQADEDCPAEYRTEHLDQRWMMPTTT